MEPTFDRDGYPTDETLDILRNWDDFSSSGYQQWIEFAHKAWHWNDMVIIGTDSENIILSDRKMVQFHTGGWSGNEDIISAMQGNVLWLVNFQNHRTGGHFELRAPREVT